MIKADFLGVLTVKNVFCMYFCFFFFNVLKSFKSSEKPFVEHFVTKNKFSCKNQCPIFIESLLKININPNIIIKL